MPSQPPRNRAERRAKAARKPRAKAAQPLPTLSLPTLEMLTDVLGKQTLAISAGDFEVTALAVVVAKKELGDLLEATRARVEAEAEPQDGS